MGVRSGDDWGLRTLGGWEEKDNKSEISFIFPLLEKSYFPFSKKKIKNSTKDIFQNMSFPTK